MSTVLFYDPKFPYAGERPSVGQLEDEFSDSAKSPGKILIVTAAELEEALIGTKPDVFVNLHGPYFPKKTWPAILSHLRRGGGLVHAGGAPFAHPVYEKDGDWIIEPRQTAYHQQLHIHEALKVDQTKVVGLRHNPDIPLLSGTEKLFSIEPTYGLTLHVTRADDYRQANGAAGPMDAHLYPLLKGVSRDGRELAAPVVLLEHTKGNFAGGRWMFVNQMLQDRFWQQDGMQAIAEWADYCASGVTEMWLKPGYACFWPGERASLTLQLQSLKSGAADRSWDCSVRIYKEDGEAIRSSSIKTHPVYEYHFRADAAALIGFTRLSLPFDIKPAYYSVICTATATDNGETRVLRQGFWGFDGELLREGEPLSCGRDYFRKDGKPLPIVGMTYMASDVARKFMHLPNAAVWDRDMAHMKKAGINLIRTGIWTAWRTFAFVDGHVSEEALRAVDAFILTGKRHGLEVTFNFFGFTPELWEGENPYLDPRSVEAQKRFIAAIATRHAETTNVQWDLINEPSMFDPDRLWAPRPAGDRFETTAFRDWLQQRHGDIRTLQERWNMTPEEMPDFASVRTPEPVEINFATTEMFAKKGGKWLDFLLFSMDMHNRWAAELTAAIKAVQPKQLVTVGQDEGLGSQRPSPLFYAEAVDYTTVHSWWLMDQLVWDGIFAKTPYKPNLIQETGMMYVETPDGRAKRTEEELRSILERKYAYAFSTGGAGAVQWLWNINHYMNNVNESNIGALRSDGTEKPEADVSYDFGRFMGEIGWLFEDRRLEDVAVVFPYSNDFSNRPLAFAATTKLTRTLAYEMNVPFRALGEYHLQALSDQPAPKLIIVPSAHNFSDEALEMLLEHIQANGGTLLFTGPLGLDVYWRPRTRLESEFGIRRLANVRREEQLVVDGRALPVSFGGDAIAKLNKEVPDAAHSGATEVHRVQLGRGTLLWCTLPVELNERSEPLIELYGSALRQAGAAPELIWNEGGDLPGVYGRKLQFREGALFIFVSEFACGCDIAVTDPNNGIAYRFKLESERTVMFAARKDGSLIATYRPHEVAIQIG